MYADGNYADENIDQSAAGTMLRCGLALLILRKSFKIILSLCRLEACDAQ